MEHGDLCCNSPASEQAHAQSAHGGGLRPRLLARRSRGAGLGALRALSVHGIVVPRDRPVFHGVVGGVDGVSGRCGRG